MGKEKVENKKPDTNLGCYGPEMKPSEIKAWLIENILDNTMREKNCRITLNIWGAAGISKTSLVKSLEHYPIEYNGKKYDGFQIVDMPISQIEEMGDVTGFPVEEIEVIKEDTHVWIKAADSVIRNYLERGYALTENQRTTYAPPSWVPKEERPGVILFDDGNRASQRIMKGIMQLVQDYRTISWELPKGWTIVFTGNPDNRFNQVTSMDTAQLTRMKHVTMTPDALEWAKWATENDIDARVINFILRYPEMMIGKERTNPRTLTEFARALKRYPDISGDNYKKVTNEAYASLDEETVETMMVFFTRSVELVIDPKIVLEKYNENAKQALSKLMKQAEPRLDIVNVVNDRLYAYITSSNYELKKEHINNLQDWLTDDNQPKDCAYAFVRRLAYSDSPYKRQLLAGNDKLMKIVQIGFGKMF